VNILNKEQRSNNMRAVKSKGSKIETQFAKALFALGYRYRKNDRTVFGTPDVSFKKIELAIFIDGEFWHGKDWEKRKLEHKTNKEFWHNKIQRNMLRDREVNKYLKQNGWKVLRFWGSDIKKSLDICILKTEKAIKSQNEKLNELH
jgi:DNA mismatch endonuclease Vsr